MSKDTDKPSVKQPTSSSTSNSEIKVLYYIDDQNPPYSTGLNVNGLPRLKNFKNASGRNCSKYKFFFASNDPSIGKVKEEIVNDEEILPSDTQNRIFAYIISIEGSTTSSSGDGEGEGNKQSKHSNHHRDDTVLPSTTNSSFNIQQPRLQCMSQRYASANNSDYQQYFAEQQASRIDVTPFPSSNSESTTFLGETEDYRYSTVTGSTTISSRYHGRNRLRGRQHRSPSGFDRASSSSSSFNSDSTMTLNISTVTLNLCSPQLTLDEESHPQQQTNLSPLRQQIYSIIKSNIHPQQCVRQLLHPNLRREEEEIELCQIILNICVQRPTHSDRARV